MFLNTIRGRIMSMVRMSITIPEELALKLDQVAGSRKKSEFITESLEERIRKMEQEELQKELAEGYKARKDESLSIAEDFEAVDLEGWDEY
jgi:metal-responsive CopG/Arc/MetJ family transcriptional regulator